MQIIKANAEHAVKIHELEKICFTDSWSLDSIKESLQYATFIIAEENKSVLGFLGYTYIFEQAQIIDLAVHPSWRKQGIASSLINYAHTELLPLGVSEVHLEVRISNMAARQLYLKHGYSAYHVRRGYYSDNGEDAIVMRKILTKTL